MRVEKIFDILCEYFPTDFNNLENRLKYSECAGKILDMLDNTPVVQQCEGYKFFKGTMIVTPKNPQFPQREVTGVWLYKPEYKCWYCNGSSFMEDICTIKEAVCL